MQLNMYFTSYFKRHIKNIEEEAQYFCEGNSPLKIPITCQVISKYLHSHVLYVQCSRRNTTKVSVYLTFVA